MYPILTRYGPFFLYTYQVVMGLGLVAALGWLAGSVRHQPAWWRALDGALWGAGAALVGGRLGFVGLNWAYFASHRAEIPWPQLGGLAYHGALSAGLLTLWGWSRRQKRSPARYADWLAPAVALMFVFGWSACYLDGCAFGRNALLGWFSADLPDVYGLFAVRYQTQLAGVLFTLLTVAWVLPAARRAWPPGVLWGLTLAALRLQRALISLFRGDVMPLWRGLRLDTLLDAGLMVVGLLVALDGVRRHLWRDKPAHNSST